MECYDGCDVAHRVETWTDLLLAPYLLQSDCSERSAVDALGILENNSQDALKPSGRCTLRSESRVDDARRREPLDAVCTAQQMLDLRDGA